MMRCLNFVAIVVVAFLAVVENGNASFHETPFKRLDSLAILLKGLNATEAKDHDRAIKIYSHVIDANNLTTKYLSLAHRARGDAYYYKGLLDIAINNYSRALEVNPKNTAAYINRGNVFLRQGKFEWALEDLNSATIRDPHSALAFQNRGNIHFFSGHYQKASSDYHRSLSLDPSDLFSVIWLFLADMRRGIDGRADLYTRTKESELSEWPGPAISLFLDAISTKQLVEIANHHAGKEKMEIISEAYFYGGEYHLLRQERKEASEMFRRVLDQGVSYLVEFAAAMVELKRMDR